MSLTIKDPAAFRPASVDQLAAAQAEDAGCGGRIVRVTDEDYQLSRYDRLVILAVTDGGSYTLTVDPGALADGQSVQVLMPEAPSGGGGAQFATSGLLAEVIFNGAGDAAQIAVCKAESVAFRTGGTA